MKRSDMIAYYKKFYHPGNAFLVISGNFKIATAKKLISKFFDANPKTKANPYPNTKLSQRSFDIN